jgi:hypothetical protein
MDCSAQQLHLARNLLPFDNPIDKPAHTPLPASYLLQAWLFIALLVFSEAWRALGLALLHLLWDRDAQSQNGTTRKREKNKHPWSTGALWAFDVVTVRDLRWSRLFFNRAAEEAEAEATAAITMYFF